MNTISLFKYNLQCNVQYASATLARNSSTVRSVSVLHTSPRFRNLPQTNLRVKGYAASMRTAFVLAILVFSSTLYLKSLFTGVALRTILEATPPPLPSLNTKMAGSGKFWTFSKKQGAPTATNRYKAVTSGLENAIFEYGDGLKQSEFSDYIDRISGVV